MLAFTTDAPPQIRWPSGRTRPHVAVGSRTIGSRDDRKAVAASSLQERVAGANLLLPHGKR